MVEIIQCVTLRKSESAKGSRLKVQNLKLAISFEKYAKLEIYKSHDRRNVESVIDAIDEI